MLTKNPGLVLTVSKRTPGPAFITFFFGPIGFSGLGIDKIAKMMGGPANFYIMTLATPVPEFNFPLGGLIMAMAAVGIVAKFRK